MHSDACAACLNGESKFSMAEFSPTRRVRKKIETVMSYEKESDL